MLDRQSNAQTPEQRARTTPLHERSIHVGEVIVVNGYCVYRASLKSHETVDKVNALLSEVSEKLVLREF